MEKEEYKQFLLRFFDLETVNKLLNEMEKEPLHCFHINPLKQIHFPEIDNLALHPYIKDAYFYKKEDFQAGKDALHHAGSYYIQDSSAMMVGKLLNVQKNDKVIDLCAAPGGKSAFVGPLLTDGILFSNEISSSRVNDLIDNIERIGLDNCIVLSDEVKNIANSLEGYFDKVILDAPCSGEGMFRKNSLMNEDWNEQKVNNLSSLQKDLILDAYKLLKRDGILVYSTCTFNQLENEEVIKYLLSNTNASIIALKSMEKFNQYSPLKGAIRLFPFNFPGEGHFICLIRCNDDHYYANKSLLQGNISNKNYEIYKKFEKETLKNSLNKERLFEFNNSLYYLPANTPKLFNLHIKRMGIKLGEFEKGYFSPSHNLGSSLIQFNNIINFPRDSQEIQLYLHGDSFKTTGNDGFNQVQVENIPLGLCKIVNGTLKNLYPKKLRKVGK